MGSVKILLIEDDTRIGGLIVRGLRRDGHAVDVATSVEDGRWHTSESAYDVLVLDVMLPDGDGFEFCRELRAAGNWTPVLLLTARDAVSDRVRGLDVGGDDYLVKPFAFAELSARLRALARRGASERPTVLEVGRLRVDPARRIATVGERDLVLTAKDFALLEHFARHPDLVLGRGQIIEEVWDWAFEGTPRIVDVYVRILRTKLGTGRDVPQLDTVRGSGYVLRGPAVGAATASGRTKLAG
jgi:two-component system OmpR family response regulator